MKRDGVDFENSRELRHLFTASLGTHRLGLSLPQHDSGPHATPGRATLAAALALRAAEPAIAMVEDWLGAGIVPTPCENRSTVAATDERRRFGGCAALLHKPSDTRLYLPVAMLLEAAKPPPEFTGWQWAPWRCRAVLDALPLSGSDREQLRSGALVLFPASFEPAWAVRLLPMARPEAQFHAQVQVLSPTELSFMPQGTPAGAPDPGRVRVSMARCVEVSPLALLGWGGAPNTGVAVRSHVAVMHGESGGGMDRLAAGRLMAVGSGFGLHLSRVRRPASAALLA
jgi:hypothetical protein